MPARIRVLWIVGRIALPLVLIAAVGLAPYDLRLSAVVLLGALLLLVLYDLRQHRHSLLRTFPVVGRSRFLIERLGPSLRQYIVASDTEERPFNRDQRRWVYSTAKGQSSAFGFGTDRDLDRSESHLIIKQSAFPAPPDDRGAAAHDLPSAKVLGGARARPGAFVPASLINISGMSFGALSGPAVEALNRGARIAGCLHNTGEGGISAHHRHGGDLIMQIGTSYFGCRDTEGRFSIPALLRTIDGLPVKAIELKLSQGAKPGLGGHVPASKVTHEIALARGVPQGQDCISPGHHTAFSNVDQMLDLVEEIAAQTGLPVGIKSAVGDEAFWVELAEEMSQSQRGVDFITIDGGEGGTGAAPLAYANHVALPFKLGFSRVYRIFSERGVAQDVFWIGSGKLGFPEASLFAVAMGCDAINVGREAMLAIGCIQTQKCFADNCPVGVATQKRWLTRALDPEDKSHRAANYVMALRSELKSLTRACGAVHPSQVGLDRLEIIDGRMGTRSASDVLGYDARIRQELGLRHLPES